MTTHVLEREQRVSRPLEEVFAFFSDAFNLERITPPELRFRILTKPPIVVRAGTLIDYRLRLYGVPFHWKTLIERFEPNVAFVDVQLRGPYKRWHHTHRFERVGERETLMQDRVEYALPFGPLGDAVHALMVRKQVERIFAYRRTFIDATFGA